MITYAYKFDRDPQKKEAAVLIIRTDATRKVLRTSQLELRGPQADQFFHEQGRPGITDEESDSISEKYFAEAEKNKRKTAR